jgi:hypothetical protein
MKVATMLGLIVLSGALAYGKDAKPRSSGTLLSMDSVECGAEQKGTKTLTGEMLGTDSAHQKTHVLLCQEYVLQTDQVIYRIRPKDGKHPALLPISTKAQFHLEKDKMKLRIEGVDDKERDYVVVSMTPRTEVSPGGSR